MKVAISSRGTDLNASIDPRFGRCPCFLIVEADAMSFEVLENQNRALTSGAGIQAAQALAASGAESVITGYCGPNASRMLSAAGIELFTGISGTVKNALEKLKKGGLSPAAEAALPERWNPGDPSYGRGPLMAGRGRGGRGMRMSDAGLGRGMGGRGMGGRRVRLGARRMGGGTGFMGFGRNPGFFRCTW